MEIEPEVPSEDVATIHNDDVATEDESTEYKLAILASLHPHKSTTSLLETLIAHAGSLDRTSTSVERDRLSHHLPTTSAAAFLPDNDDGSQERPRKRFRSDGGYQSSLSSFAKANGSPANSDSKRPRRLLTQKGKTLHLYSPEDIEAHTPCSIVHNFLPVDLADALLKELLQEATGFKRASFQLFDRTVQSPHTWKFYVDETAEVEDQKTEYVYEGVYESNVAKTPPEMLKVSSIVRDTVQSLIGDRIRNVYPGGKELKFQSRDAWVPNVSFVNCYDGPTESVGWHADQLTYLGSRAVIGSLSLGVAREFRIRKVLPKTESTSHEDGQISLHLPHNSLLVMHAEMQEEWKHSIAPAKVITPHSLADNKRFNITYRCYRDYLHPKLIPRCQCDKPAILRCMQKKAESRGRYMWMCAAGYNPGQKGCSFFSWAELDERGKPPWADGYSGNCNV